MTPTRTTTEPKPDELLSLGSAYEASQILLSAIELGIFTELARGALDAETLTARLGLNGRGAADFLDALVALRLLRRRHGFYENATARDLFLDRCEPSFLGDARRLTDPHHHSRWMHLTQALRTGHAPDEAVAAGEDPTGAASDADAGSSFHAMTSGSLMTALALARRFPWDEYRSFADIGPAQCATSVQMALAHPHLRGVCFDQPPLRPLYESCYSARGVQDRLGFVGGDVPRDELPPADVLLLSRGLHRWRADERRRLLSNVYRALTDEGAVIVCGILTDARHRRRVPGLLLSLSILLETPDGAALSGAECVAGMMAAGFREVMVNSLIGAESMVVGIK